MFKRALAVLAGLAATALVPAVPAIAAPTGEYAVFAQCPIEDPAVEGCVHGTTESGEFVIGKKTVPITKTITLQGGIYENEETETKYFVGAANGETLSKTPQNVPGGLAGLVDCREISEPIERLLCKVTFENGATGVNATSEIAGPVSGIEVNPGKILNKAGVGVRLPIKVHLENPLLGSECYLGSDAEPMVLELTSGTTSPPPPNTPITGSAGEQSYNAEGTILTLHNNVLVDNAFAAPGANGCGGALSFLLDPIIDSQMGVPSPAGENTAILEGTLESANAQEVREHS